MEDKTIKVSDWVEYRGLYGEVVMVVPSGQCVIKFVGGTIEAVSASELSLVTKQQLVDHVMR